MQLKKEALDAIEKIIRNANLETTLSAEALNSVVQLKKDFDDKEKECNALKEDLKLKNEKIEKLNNEISVLNNIIDGWKKTEDSLNLKETDLRAKELALQEQDFKLKFYVARGDEMKEILGMALRNTEFKKSIEFNNSSTHTRTVNNYDNTITTSNTVDYEHKQESTEAK